MDEGSTSTDDDYQFYKTRFSSIFDTSTFESRVSWCFFIICFSDCRMKTNFITQVIYLPGDNDIGGEGTDHVTRSKIERFNANFPNQIESVYGNIQFVVVRIAQKKQNKNCK